MIVAGRATRDCLDLNKREWVWGLKVNEAWSYCYGCLQVHSLYLASPLRPVLCVFWSLYVSVPCESTWNIRARKPGSDTSYYQTNEGCQFSSFIYGAVESRSGREYPGPNNPFYGRPGFTEDLLYCHYTACATPSFILVVKPNRLNNIIGTFQFLYMSLYLVYKGTLLKSCRRRSQIGRPPPNNTNLFK